MMRLLRRSLGFFATLVLMLSFALGLLPLSRLPAAHADVVSQGFPALSGDGYVVNADAIYANAVNATAGTVFNSSSMMIIGQSFQFDTYYVYRGFLFFDTSSLPPDIGPSSIILSIGVTANNAQTGSNITVLKPSVTNDFWTNASPHLNLLAIDFDLSLYDTSVEVGRWSTTNMSSPPNQYVNITLSDLTCVNKTGITRFILRSDGDVAQTAPTQAEAVEIAASESGFPAQLYVTYDYVSVKTQTLKVVSCDGAQASWTYVGIAPYLNGKGYPTDYVESGQSGDASDYFAFQSLSSNWSNRLITDVAFAIHLNPDNASDNVTMHILSASGVYNCTFSPNQIGWVTMLVSPHNVYWNMTNVNSMQVSFTTQGDMCFDWIEARVYGWTLIDRLAWYLNPSNTRIDWTANGDSLYFGLVFNKTTATQLQNWMDSLPNASNWRSWNNVLAWYARTKKLGLENQTTIQYALGNASQVGGVLPKSGNNYFLVYDRDVLYSALYYSDKYNFTTSKWNATLIHQFLRNHSYPTSRAFGLEIGDDGTIVLNDNRFYDENAECASVYMILYEFGETSALADAESVWNYVNNNHWDEANQRYNYRPAWIGFECEAPYFLKIFNLLYYYDISIGHISRLYSDTNTRFLSDSWSSPQWCGTSPTDRTYVCVHMYQNNPQRRLENTLGIWFDLLGTYNAFNAVQQQKIRDMLTGTSAYDPAWMLTYSSNAKLYDDNYGMFKWSSDAANVSSEATETAITQMFLQGICPLNTSLAFPLEELHYEYNYDIDPYLFNMSIPDRTVTVSLTAGGALRFAYGDSPVAYNFSQDGIWQLTFNESWTGITSATRLGNLPLDRKYLKLTDYAVTKPTISKSIVGQGYNLNITGKVENQGNRVENFSMSLYANSTFVESQWVTLTMGDSAVVQFSWNTTRFRYGTYTLTEHIESLSGEASMSADNFTAGTVIVTIPGDIDGDFKVSPLDLNTLLVAYGGRADGSGQRPYNPNCDIDDNSYVGPIDLNTLLSHYSWHYP